MIEAGSRIITNKLLKESDWILPGDDGVINVEVEIKNEAGFADYVLKDSSDFPLCIIEAKKELISPLVGKEQARGSAESLNCRFVILSNGVSHYFWDIKQGSPNVIDIFPTQQQLELRKEILILYEMRMKILMLIILHKLNCLIFRITLNTKMKILEIVL